MRVAPVSADLLIKLALAGIAVGAVIYAVGQIRERLGSVADSLPPADYFNPASDQNFIYQGVSSLGDTVAGDGQSRPWGVRLYEWLNPDAVAAEKAATSTNYLR